MPEPKRVPTPTRLKITDDKGFEKVVLIEDDVFSIGRDASCSLPLPEEGGESIAPRHALIVRDGSGYTLKTETGSCGTRVNGRPIRRVVLKHGDRITLGSSSLRFQFLVEGTRTADHEEKKTYILIELLRELHACPQVEEISARAVAGIVHLIGPEWTMVVLRLDPARPRIAAAGDTSGKLPGSISRQARLVLETTRSHFQPDHLCASIPGKDRSLGVLDIGPSSRSCYTARDLEMLEALASHVGVALTNALCLGDHPALASLTTMSRID